MKVLRGQSYRSVYSMIALSFGLLFGLFALPCWAQEDTTDLAFDVFNEPIDSTRIYLYLEKMAKAQKEIQAADAAEVLYQQFVAAQTGSDVGLDSLINHPLMESDDLYPHMVKSCLYLGRFYDCGKCDRSHVAMSCGVVIDESGLALTNSHVLRKRDDVITEGFMAMNYEGRCFEVEEVLAADPNSDIALVRLKANGHKFYAAPIAKTLPTPTTEIRMVSHPSGEFFVMTKGEVSRHVLTRTSKSSQTWMEVTADFGGGSSGCGIFNSAGEVIGIASRIKPLNRPAQKVVRNGKVIAKPQYVEMVLRRCVDLPTIHACFEPNEPADAPAVVESGESTASKKATNDRSVLKN